MYEEWKKYYCKIYIYINILFGTAISEFVQIFRFRSMHMILKPIFLISEISKYGFQTIFE